MAKRRTKKKPAEPVSEPAKPVAVDPAFTVVVFDTEHDTPSHRYQPEVKYTMPRAKADELIAAGACKEVF